MLFYVMSLVDLLFVYAVRLQLGMVSFSVRRATSYLFGVESKYL